MTDVPSADLLARYRQNDPAAAGKELFQRYADRPDATGPEPAVAPVGGSRRPGGCRTLGPTGVFFVLARGEITLKQSGDLWRLLARITIRKVYRNARRHRAELPQRRARGTRIRGDGRCPGSRRAVPPADPRGVRRPARRIAVRAGASESRAAADRPRCAWRDTRSRRSPALVERSARTVRRTLAALGEELERRPEARPAPASAPSPRPGALLSYGDIVLQQQLGRGRHGEGLPGTAAEVDMAQVAVKLLRKPAAAARDGDSPFPGGGRAAGPAAASRHRRGTRAGSAGPTAGTSW